MVIIINKTLSVCIISKNEENSIEKCIKSLIKVANEIVLVDTGSNDKTIEIAKGFGITVIEETWKDDFSAARNKSLEYATKDWVLFIDCDEELTEEGAIELKKLINNEDVNKRYEGFFLRLSNMVKGNKVAEDKVVRLFKNNKRYRFEGQIHEQIRNSIQSISGMDSIGKSTIEILHYGYNSTENNREKKNERNLNILLNYEQEKKDGYYYYNLGNQYFLNRDYDSAITAYNKALTLTEVEEVDYNHYSYLAINLVKTYYAQKKFNQCIKFIDIFNKLLPDFKDIFFIKCLCSIEIGNVIGAQNALEQYVNCKQGNYRYPINYYGNYYDIEKLSNELTKLC